MTRIEYIRHAPSPSVASQLNLFPAPLLVFCWDEAAYWRDEILDAVSKRRRSDKGMQRTNVGGWHSRRDLPGWPEPGVQALVRWAAAQATHATANWRQNGVQPAPTRWRMDGWANVNPAGGAFNRAHDHSILKWNWSGCYYLSTGGNGDGAAGGAIVFEDRGAGLQTKSTADDARRSFRHVPTEGELLIWPSWLPHRVESHSQGSDRVSIAMNFHSPWLEKSRYWTHRPGFLWRKFPALMRPLARLRGSWDQSPSGMPPGFDIDAEPNQP